MKVQFTKMHGCGNDYIYVDASRFPIADPSEAARRWSDRHRGIGSDGLVLIDRLPSGGADFSMRIFNADGSEAMMCGNACRCIAMYLYERQLTSQTDLRLLTRAGIKMLKLHLDDDRVASVTVDMGQPAFSVPAQFAPLQAEGLMAMFPPETRAMFVSMGNPHYVIITDDVDRVADVGPLLERHPAFPERCNIELVRLVEWPDQGPDGVATLRLRVWERGSGVTQACGTGACATAVAACRLGLAARRSLIVMDGGTLSIEWRKADGHVCMTGPAETVYDGEIEI